MIFQNVAILLPTFVPQPQLTLSMSLAMIRGFARGMSDNIAPYIEKKAAQIEADNIHKAFNENGNKRASQMIAKEMYFWLRLLKSEQYATQKNLWASELKGADGILKVDPTPKELKDYYADASRKIFIATFKSPLGFQSKFCAKDRHGLNDPTYADSRKKNREKKTSMFSKLKKR